MNGMKNPGILIWRRRIGAISTVLGFVLRKLDDGTWVDKYGGKVTRFGFHNFRHSLATFLIEKGHDPLVVQRMLRHSHVDMTMHYTHNSHKRREAQADFIERFLPEGERV